MALNEWTQDQWASHMEESRREWVSTAPLDRAKIEQAIRDLGIKLPIVWAASPVELGVIASTFNQLVDADKLNSATRLAIINGLVTQWLGNDEIDPTLRAAYKDYRPALIPMLSEEMFNSRHTYGQPPQVNVNNEVAKLNSSLQSALGWNWRREVERPNRWRPLAITNAINVGTTEYLQNRPRFEIDKAKVAQYRESFVSDHIERAVRTKWDTLLQKYGLKPNEPLYATFSKWLDASIKSELNNSTKSTGQQIDGWTLMNFLRTAFAAWAETVEIFDAGVKDGVITETDESRRIVTSYKALRGAAYILQTQLAVIIAERPVELHRDDRRRLHKSDGPAAKWKDGFELYALNGVVLPKSTLDSVSTLTPQQIFRTRNVEQRRVLMDLYGIDKIFEADAKEIGQRVVEVSKDDMGRLLRIDQFDDEPIVVVAVKNSTPEPDGTIKDYFLRVPPRMRTPTQALAWTFGTRVDRYAPEIET